MQQVHTDVSIRKYIKNVRLPSVRHCVLLTIMSHPRALSSVNRLCSSRFGNRGSDNLMDGSFSFLQFTRNSRGLNDKTQVVSGLDRFLADFRMLFRTNTTFILPADASFTLIPLRSHVPALKAYG